MKILYILPVLLFCKISLAQDIPEIPMKNDLVYYELKNTLQNEKQCLSQYHTSAMGKVGVKKQAIDQNQKFFKDVHYDIFMMPFIGKLKPACKDTCTNGVFMIMIPPTSSIISSTSLFGLIRDLVKAKISEHNITASFEVIYLAKNEYILKFKDFQYNVTTMKANKIDRKEQIPLNELYNDLLNTEKKSKSQIEIFNAVNYFINASNEMFSKSLTELYRADEL
jgi:hypothetical protein